jgi:hypothetical protein
MTKEGKHNRRYGHKKAHMTWSMQDKNLVRRESTVRKLAKHDPDIHIGSYRRGSTFEFLRARLALLTGVLVEQGVQACTEHQFLSRPDSPAAELHAQGDRGLPHKFERVTQVEPVPRSQGAGPSYRFADKAMASRVGATFCSALHCSASSM